MIALVKEALWRNMVEVQFVSTSLRAALLASDLGISAEALLRLLTVTLIGHGATNAVLRNQSESEFLELCADEYRMVRDAAQTMQAEDAAKAAATAETDPKRSADLSPHENGLSQNGPSQNGPSNRTDH